MLGEFREEVFNLVRFMSDEFEKLGRKVGAERGGGFNISVMW